MKESFEAEVLVKEIQQLKRKVAEYEKTLESYEIDEIEILSDTEYICVEEIKKMKNLSAGRGLTDDEIKSLDILHKNLRQCRKDQELGKKKLKEKETDVTELLSIVNNKQIPGDQQS
jgi:hypothetical protein